MNYAYSQGMGDLGGRAKKVVNVLKRGGINTEEEADAVRAAIATRRPVASPPKANNPGMQRLLELKSQKKEELQELLKEWESQPQLGRIEEPGTGRIVSARLNPDIIAEAAIPSEQQINAMLAEVGEAPLEKAPELKEEDEDAMAEGGARRRQKGAGWQDVKNSVNAKYVFTKNALLLATKTVAEVVGVAVTTLKEKGSAAGKAAAARVTETWASTEQGRAAALEAVKVYLTEELNPLGTVGLKLLKILLRLAEQIFIKTPVTVGVTAMAGVGATANFVRFLFDISNTWTREVAMGAVDDKKAKEAAAAALASVKSVGTTAIVGVAVANQLGVLPMSAVLAAILFALQVNLGTGPGRAYLITGFYAWYKSQKPEDQQAIKTAAENYGAAAKDAVVARAKEATPQIKAAATQLGGLLAKAGKGGKNAVQAVAEKLKPAEKPPVPEAAPAAALENGAPAAVAVAAAVVAAPAEAGTGGPPAGRGGRARKTSKRGMKRRMTRRRKAPKYLAAPVFAY